VGGDDRPDDGEPEAGAAAVAAAGLVEAGEPLEDPLAVRRRDADSGVYDLDRDSRAPSRLRRRSRAQRDHAALRELHGIPEEVDEYLADLPRVAL
jgi:hypothetical protein